MATMHATMDSYTEQPEQPTHISRYYRVVSFQFVMAEMCETIKQVY